MKTYKEFRKSIHENDDLTDHHISFNSVEEAHSAAQQDIEEKNVPTNPTLWSKAKSLAKSKFDVYPSAYANGWAAKWYKSKGGGWKTE